jgi:hypothetical protein
MALLFIDSFDHYQTAELPSKWTSVSAAALFPGGIVAGVGRCGTQAVHLSGIIEKGIPFGSTTGILGFAVEMIVQSFNTEVFATFGTNSGSGTQVYLVRNLDGSLQVWRADAAPVILGTTAPDVVRLNQYYFIEFKATISNAAGVIEVRVNGVTVLNLTGQNTHSNQCPDLTITKITFVGSTGFQTYTDDVYVLDDTGSAPWNTFLGDCRVEYLRPDGVGANQSWDLVGAATHWQAVDDNATPDDDTSYIHTATAGAVDTQTYQPTSLPAGSIFGLQVNLYARKTDGGARLVAPVIRHAGVDYVGVDQAPSFPSYIYLIQTYMTNPGTGVAWSIAGVNAIEAGVKVTL